MRILFIISIALALSACSDNPVDAEEVEQIDINGEWEELIEVENPIRFREIITLDLTSHDDNSVSGMVNKRLTDYGVSNSYGIIRQESFYLDGKIQLRYGQPAVMQGTTHFRSHDDGSSYPVIVIAGNDEVITFFRSSE